MATKGPFFKAAALVSSLWLASLYLLVKQGYVAIHFDRFGGTTAAEETEEETTTALGGTKWAPVGPTMRETAMPGTKVGLIEAPSSPLWPSSPTINVQAESLPMLPKYEPHSPQRDTLMAGTKSYSGAVTIQGGTLPYGTGPYQRPASAEPVTVQWNQPNGLFQTPLAPRAGIAPALAPRQQLMMGTKSAPVLPPSTFVNETPESGLVTVQIPNAPRSQSQSRPNAPATLPATYQSPPYAPAPNGPPNSPYAPTQPPTYTPPPKTYVLPPQQTNSPLQPYAPQAPPVQVAPGYNLPQQTGARR